MSLLNTDFPLTSSVLVTATCCVVNGNLKLILPESLNLLVSVPKTLFSFAVCAWLFEVSDCFCPLKALKSDC